MSDHLFTRDTCNAKEINIPQAAEVEEEEEKEFVIEVVQSGLVTYDGGGNRESYGKWAYYGTVYGKYAAETWVEQLNKTKPGRVLEARIRP